MLLPPLAMPNSMPITPSETPSPLDAPPTTTTTTIASAIPLPPTKQSNPSRPTRSRPRRERPCDACRRRKTRCVMVEGNVVCAFCQFHGKGCTFVQEPLPRTRKVKETDDALAGDGEHDGQHSPCRVKRRHSQSSSPPNYSHHHNNTTTTGLSLHHISHPPPCTDNLSTSDTFTAGILQSVDFSADAFNAIDFKLVSHAYTLQGLPSSPEGSHNFDVHQEDELRMMLAPYRGALVELYFRFVHTDYPILDEREFSALSNHADGTNNNPSYMLLLAAVSLTALPFWDQSPALAQLAPPHVQRLEELIYWPIFHFPAPTTLATVQAGLLLLHRPAFQTWSLTCQLVALAQDVDLHLDCTRWTTIGEAEKSVRRRTAWAVYVHDKWSALIHGRPSHIHDEIDWTVSPLCPADFCDIYSSAADTDDADVCMVFRQMVSLTNIVSSILRTVQCTSLTLHPGNSTSTTRTLLAAAKPIQMQLKSWHATLPASMKLDNDNFTANVASTGAATGSLHLAYYAAEITLHRILISSLPFPSLSSTHQDTHLPPILRLAAKSRLISAMDFINRLRPHHLSATFWHLPSTHNLALVARFGALLRATAEDAGERAFYEARLGEYRWTLGVSACGGRRAGWLSEAVEIVDAEANGGDCDEVKMSPSTSDDAQFKKRKRPQTQSRPHSSSSSSTSTSSINSTVSSFVTLQSEQRGEQCRDSTFAEGEGAFAKHGRQHGQQYENTQNQHQQQEQQQQQQQQQQHTSASLAALRASLGLDDHGHHDHIHGMEEGGCEDMDVMLLVEEDEEEEEDEDEDDDVNVGVDVHVKRDVDVERDLPRDKLVDDEDDLDHVELASSSLSSSSSSL